MKKGMKKQTLTGTSNNKAEMINNAISHIEALGHEITRGKWCGYFDGLEWDQKYIFIFPAEKKEIAKQISQFSVNIN